MPRAASLTRMPICGRTPTFSAYFRISSSSVYFSTTGMMLRPIFWASIAVSMNSASLKPLQMIGVSLVAIAATASSSGLEPASRPKPVLAAEVHHLLHDLALLVHLDRVDADVAALVLVLGDGVLERRVDLADAVLEDVGEADEDRGAQAAQLEPVDQLLQIDRPGGVTGRVHLHVPGLVHREVALAPARHLVELGGVGRRPLRRGAAVWRPWPLVGADAHRAVHRE